MIYIGSRMKNVRSSEICQSDDENDGETYEDDEDSVAKRD